MNRLRLKAFAGLLFLFVAMAALLFVAAGTRAWWQAWTFLAVYFGSSLALTPSPLKEGPGVVQAGDAGRAHRRERTRSEDHHVDHVAGICRSACRPRARSSLRLVADAALSGAGRGRAGRSRLARHLFRLPGKQLHVCHH